MNTAYSYFRFSNPTQAQGASLCRQIEAAEAYAKEKGLVIDKSLTFRDFGVSAYRGKNFEDGQLGAFIRAVESGRVMPGSVLLVENLDRLSRAEVPVALERFLSILRLGIKIVTLTDGQEYSSEIVSEVPTRLLISIIFMIRAHDESAIKGKRVQDAWARKRQAAVEQGKPLTRQCPAWLTIKDGKYAEIPERVALVREMFRRMDEGEGQGRIANDFTRRKIEPWGGKKHKCGGRWHDSYLQLIACNRAVLGEFRMFKGNGKDRREPVGEPIKNYFPPIIPLDLFVRVNAARETRRIRGCCGRQGERISNLFQGLVFDLHTHRRCVYMNHGKWRYLTVPSKQPNQRGWPYEEFESVFLLHCRLLDWTGVFGDSTKTAVAEARSAHTALLAQATTLDGQLARMTEALTLAPDLPPVLAKLRELQSARDGMTAELRIAEQTLATAISRQESLANDAARIQGLASEDPQDRQTRLRLREEIRRVVSRIYASFIKRRGFFMIIHYANGAVRYLQPRRDGKGVRIYDQRECGFLGTPEEWDQGAAALFDPEFDPERTAQLSAKHAS